VSFQREALIAYKGDQLLLNKPQQSSKSIADSNIITHLSANLSQSPQVLSNIVALFPCALSDRYHTVHTTRYFVKSMAGFTQEEGEIDFLYEGEKFQTFYKTFGDVRDRSKRPLIVLHGGPGLVHDYLLPHSDLTSKYEIPIILYDQLGNGRSTHLKDKAPEFWTIGLFIAELENVIDYFGVQDGFDILGHSWGGILASEFEVRKQPSGLNRLILTNSLAAHSLWKESNRQLLQAFPDDVRQAIAGGIKEEPEKFNEALKKLHAVHGCTVKPLPAEFTRTMGRVIGPEGDPTVASVS
jgi:pimeloyl-ACP methyl ester carboxylesterase